MCTGWRRAAAARARHAVVDAEIAAVGAALAAGVIAEDVRPTDAVLAVRAGRRGYRLGTYRWGLIPRWATDPTRFRATFNARPETVADLPAFRDAWRAGRRCLLVADACYEWRPGGAPTAPKQRLAVSRADGMPLVLAGLWEPRRDPDTGQVSASCTMLTTEPSPAWAAVHHRMPVILERGDLAAWLDPETPSDRAHRLCVPSDADLTITPQHPAPRTAA